MKNANEHSTGNNTMSEQGTEPTAEPRDPSPEYDGLRERESVDALLDIAYALKAEYDVGDSEFGQQQNDAPDSLNDIIVKLEDRAAAIRLLTLDGRDPSHAAGPLDALERLATTHKMSTAFHEARDAAVALLRKCGRLRGQTVFTYLDATAGDPSHAEMRESLYPGQVKFILRHMGQALDFSIGDDEVFEVAAKYMDPHGIDADSLRDFASEMMSLCVARLATPAAPRSPDIESLAEAVHEAYLTTCARLGWDVKPANQVPYAELSEDSKELDRASVRAVLSRVGAAPVAEQQPDALDKAECYDAMMEALEHLLHGDTMYAQSPAELIYRVADRYAHYEEG